MAETLRVTVSTQIDDETPTATTTVLGISPDYDPADIAAFTVRAVENTAFKFNRERFGRAPTMQALVAAAARIEGVRRAVDDPEVEDLDTLRARIRAILILSNADVTELYGEEPEGL